MAGFTLSIDDTRYLEVDIIARNYNSGIAALIRFKDMIDTLYLDHDLGCFDNQGNEYTGYMVCEWALANGFMPPRVKLVTANPGGGMRMAALLKENGYKHDMKTNAYVKEKE